MKPGTDERDAEKAVRDEIEKIETEEQQPAIQVDEMQVPLDAVEDGENAQPILAPDGTRASVKGRVVTQLTAQDVHYEKMRQLAPCISCVHLFFPKPGTHDWSNRAAHVANALRIGALYPGTTEAEFGGCTVKKMWVQVSYHCGQHRFRKSWWSRMKAWVVSMRGKAR